MNHKQINDLYRFNQWGQHEPDQIGIWFILKEDYELKTDFDSMIIPKGLRLKFIGPTITAYRFEPDPPLPRYFKEIILGRSRLLKMKLSQEKQIKRAEVDE